MFASLKNKIKEETGNDPVLHIRPPNSSRFSKRDSLYSTSSIDELGVLEQKDAEINALKHQLNDISTRCDTLVEQLQTLTSVKKQYEKDAVLLEESLNVAQVQKDIICEEQDKIQNLQAQEIAKLKSLLLFREQEALDRLTILKQSQQQVDNLKSELSRIKKIEPMLDDVQDEFEQFRHESQHEKNQLLTNLAVTKEDNRFLKSRLEIYENSLVNFIANLPIEEKVETLLNERKLLEQRLEEAHLHLTDIKSSWSGQNLTLETQLSRLSRQVAEETNEKRKIASNFEKLHEKFIALESTNLKMEQEINHRNSKIKLLEDEIEDLNVTLSNTRLENEDEIKFLQNKVSELQEIVSGKAELNEFKESSEQTTNILNQQIYNLEDANRTLTKQLEKESSEKQYIAMQNTELLQNEEIQKNELRRRREEMTELSERMNLVLDEQSEKECCITDLHKEIDTLKLLLSKYRERIIDLDKLDHELTEKNKTIKILNQRLVDMKKTLQHELKTGCSGQNGNTYNLNYNNNINNNSQEKHVFKICPYSGKIIMDEVNFKYLKHVIFKFLTSREIEARHLIRAVATLLQFTTEEEKLLHDTLNWKMSWFGSKPDHGTGQLAISIPPSL